MAKTRFRRKSHGKKNKTARRQKRQSRRMRGGMPRKRCDPSLFQHLKNDGELFNMIDEHPTCSKLWTTDIHGNEQVVDLPTVKGHISTQQAYNPKNWATSDAVIHRHSNTHEYQLTQCLC
jgi:hypothetical protein